MSISDQDFTRLMNQLSIKLVGASQAGIKSELFEVLTEFFDISSCWQEQLDMNCLAYTTEYDLVVAEGQIIRLGGVMASTIYSTAAALEAAENAKNGQSLGLTTVPAFMPEVGKLRLANASSNPQAMRIVVVKNVSLPNTQDGTPVGPNWVIPKWGRYIIDGVLGNMMGQPNKSYTNDTLGTYHMKKFQEGISRARVATMRANTYGAQAWSFPRAFGTRSQKGFLNTAGRSI